MNLRKCALMAFFLLLPVTANAADNSADLNRFWKVFRDAVVRGDSAEIASMTRFPFETRGPDDSDVVKYFNREQFPAVFKQVVSQQVIVLSGQQGKSMLQIITEKEALATADLLTPDIFTVELFRFQLIKGRWLFTRAYIEDS